MPGIWRIFITPLSIAISWISTTPATGDLPASRRMLWSAFNCMKAPVAFCCGTVARTQGSVMLTWALALQAMAKSAREWRVRVVFMDESFSGIQVGMKAVMG